MEQLVRLLPNLQSLEQDIEVVKYELTSGSGSWRHGTCIAVSVCLRADNSECTGVMETGDSIIVDLSSMKTKTAFP